MIFTHDSIGLGEDGPTHQPIGRLASLRAMPAVADVSARVAVEQGSAFGWDRYVGPTGTTIAMRTSGASAPLKDLQQRFGFTPAAIVEAARAQLDAAR